MTREEMADLIDFILLACPQQRIGRATAIAWYEIIGDLDFAAARNAVIAVKHSQTFVDVSDIAREAGRAKNRAIGTDPERHPSARSARDAIAASSQRELEAAPATPPTPEYAAAKAEMDERIRKRAEQVMLTDREASRRAGLWLDYKLSGKLPPALPLSAPPAPRWQPLPGDPPELRAWLASRDAEP